MKAIVNFSNILVAIILLLLGLAVFTRHRIASYVVGGFIMVLAALSVITVNAKRFIVDLQSRNHCVRA